MRAESDNQPLVHFADCGFHRLEDDDSRLAVAEIDSMIDAPYPEVFDRLAAASADRLVELSLRGEQTAAESTDPFVFGRKGSVCVCRGGEGSLESAFPKLRPTLKVES